MSNCVMVDQSFVKNKKKFRRALKKFGNVLAQGHTYRLVDGKEKSVFFGVLFSTTLTEMDVMPFLEEMREREKQKSDILVIKWFPLNDMSKFKTTRGDKFGWEVVSGALDEIGALRTPEMLKVLKSVSAMYKSLVH